MSIIIKGMSKPKGCVEEWDFGLMGNPCKFLETDMSCLLQPESEPFDCGENYNTCPLIEIDLERDIPTIWYNRQTGLYEPKGTKQEVYEMLYKLKNGERRADEHTD